MYTAGDLGHIMKLSNNLHRLTHLVFWLVLSILTCQSLRAHEPHDVIMTLAVSPNFAHDKTLLAATGNFTLKFGAYAILKSVDGGTTWSTVPGLPSNTEMTTIVFSPAYSQDQTIFISGLGGLFGTTNGGHSWSLLQKDPLQAVALSPNFATDGTLFVVTTNKTILKSTDRGVVWTTMATPSSLTGGLTTIAVFPNYTADNTLLLGSSSDGIFASTNGGGAWITAASGLAAPAVTSLVFSPGFRTDRTAFAGTSGAGVLVSTSGGLSWTPSNSGITDLNIASITLSPTYLRDSRLWVSTFAGGVFRSDTRGSSWNPGTTVSRALSVQTNVHYRVVAAAAATPSNVLYLGMWEGLWYSGDQGSTWQYIDTIPTRLIRYITLSPNYSQDKTVYASTYGGGNLWSATGGSTWTFQNTGMTWPYTDPSGISPNYAFDGTAFTGLSLGLQRTTDRGATWELVGQVTYVRALAISPNYAKDSTLFIGLKNGTKNPCVANPPFPYTGLYLSKDGGRTWLNTGLTRKAAADCWGVTGTVMSPAFATDRTGFAAALDGVHKSTDGGMNWTLLSASPKQSNVVAISPNYAQDQTLFVTGLNSGVFKSTDGGTTWSPVSRMTTVYAMDLQFSPNYGSDHTLFIATTQKGLLKSTDGGATLSPLKFPDSFITAVGISPSFGTDRTVFAAGYHGLFKSADGGATWTYTVEPARIEDSRSVSSSSAEQGPTITYQGTWTSLASDTASTTSYMSTSVTGDTATLHFTGSGVRWITQTGPTQGTALIQLDGVPITTISLTALSDQYQQNVWEQHGIACNAHTLTITALPLAGQTVTVDAFDVWVDTCPL